MGKHRRNSEDRRAEILCAVSESCKQTQFGYVEMTRESAAKYAKVSAALITHYFKSMENLRLEIIRYAIMCGDLNLIAQGIYANDPTAKNVSVELKQRAIDKHRLKL